MTTGSTNGHASGPSEVAMAFFAAVRRADANAVWNSFSVRARQYIVDRGIKRGLAPEPAQKLLDGTADAELRTQFVADVLRGIVKDLDSVRLDLVELDAPTPAADGSVRIVYLERFEIVVGPPLDPLPVGSLVLILEQGGWKIDRLIPRPGG